MWPRRPSLRCSIGVEPLCRTFHPIEENPGQADPAEREAILLISRRLRSPLLGGERGMAAQTLEVGDGGAGGRYMQIASGIHRIGDRSIINAYLIEEANEVTLVDAGVAGLYQDRKSTRLNSSHG